MLYLPLLSLHRTRLPQRLAQVHPGQQTPLKLLCSSWNFWRIQQWLICDLVRKEFECLAPARREERRVRRRSFEKARRLGEVVFWVVIELVAVRTILTRLE